MHEESNIPCESKPKKTETVKKESLFFFRSLFFFKSRKDASTVEEVKKIEEKEEEVPCASNSHQEEEITSPLEEACENVITLMKEQPHASTVGAADTFEDGTFAALQEVPNADREQLGCTALCNMDGGEISLEMHFETPWGAMTFFPSHKSR